MRRGPRLGTTLTQFGAGRVPRGEHVSVEIAQPNNHAGVRETTLIGRVDARRPVGRAGYLSQRE